MNQALQIISVQYELIFALTESPELKKMLPKFLRVCNTRLNLVSSHIFLYHSKEGYPSHSDDAAKKNRLKHYSSVPSQKNGVYFSEDENFLHTVTEFDNNTINYKESSINETMTYFLEIVGHGVLVIEAQHDLGKTLQGQLTPVIDRLGLSCSAAINRETLIREVEARKAAEEHILFQANHDVLTGLYNRRYITKKINKRLEKCKNNDRYGALIFIDLNNFKTINDVMGHTTGDLVLNEFSNRLKSVIPKKFPIARFGGDEFVILLHQSNAEKNKQNIFRFVNNILSEIEKPFSINGNTYSLSCSIGYDILSKNTKSAEQLIKNADLAMYEAKKSSINTGLMYSASMSERLEQKNNYKIELRQALENDEFELHYQPQYNQRGEMIGTEALLRWNHPERGYESPAVYIPIAEQSDLIIHISEWVLNQACHDIKILEGLKPPSTFKKTSINISAKHIAKQNFVDSILSAIQKHRIQPNNFAIEITEGIMMGNVTKSIDYLNTLKSHGIECSIDDFGTGYSSLAYLKQLPADIIKIDRAFVKDLNKDKDNYSISKMIIDLGDNLNMDVIAEGIETQAELDCLIELGCFQYQGFYFCRPIPFDQLLELLFNKGQSFHSAAQQ